MSEDGDRPDAARDGVRDGARERAAPRRRREEVFGDVLPASTGDDREPPGGDGGRGDEWLRRNVPPHHG